MGLVNHDEVKDYIRACQDPDHLRVMQHLVTERVAMFQPPLQGEGSEAQKANVARPMIAAGPAGFDKQKAAEFQRKSQ